MEIYKVITYYEDRKKIEYYKNPIIKPKDGFNLYRIRVTRGLNQCNEFSDFYWCTVDNILTGKTIYEFSYEFYKHNIDILVEPRRETRKHVSGFINLYKIVEFVLEKSFYITDHWRRIKFKVNDDLYINLSWLFKNVIQVKGWDKCERQLFRIEYSPNAKGVLKLFKYSKKYECYREKKYMYYIDNGDIITNLDYMNNNKKAKKLLNARYDKVKKCIDYIQFDPLDYDIV